MVRWSSALSFLALVWCVVPAAALAQPRLGMSERAARAKSMMDQYRAQLSAEQYALLSSRLAQTEQAYVELTALTEAGGEAAVVAAESGAAAQAAATAGRALLGGVADLLPVLTLLWPSTAHAPGMKEEKPEVRAARSKLEQRIKDLTEAVRQVEEKRGAAPASKSDWRNRYPKYRRQGRSDCLCVCGEGRRTLEVGPLAMDPDCRAACVNKNYAADDYTCTPL